MKKKITIGAALIACAIGAAYWSLHATQAKPAEAEANAEAVNALVSTKMVAQQKLVNNLTAFGDVIPGKIVALNFPQAGQIAQLAVVPGQQVHAGQLLAVLITDPQIQAAYTQAAHAASFAEAESRRNEELFTLQLATKSQVDSAHKALQDAQSNLESQRKLGGGPGNGALNAEFDGVVTAIPVSQGDRVQAGATILQLGHTTTLRVQLGIEPDEAGRIKAGMPVTLFPVQAPGRRIQAKISEMQNVIDSKTSLVMALADVPGNISGGTNAPQLVAGLHMQGTIHTGDLLAWAVPRQAVLNDEKGNYLFQVKQGKALRVEVKKLQESNDIVGVDGKLDAALPVVILGNYELEDGMPVREAKR